MLHAQYFAHLTAGIILNGSGIIPLLRIKYSIMSNAQQAVL
jgi:hypothetical protein